MTAPTQTAERLARPWGIGTMLFLLALAVMAPVTKNGFVSFDDDIYITANSRVQDGLTCSGIRWAFTEVHAYNWHPLTWLSHMLDCQLYGLNPAGHHFTSLVIYAFTVLLLFLAFYRMTHDLSKSAWVAALFAVHPLHVESVAWASERKDVLSGLFWMLTLLAYAGYVRRPSARRYAATLGFFVLGLMSKQMLVTLPFVLLLLDFWPLGRLSWATRSSAVNTVSRGSAHRTFVGLVMEKLPFLVLAGVASFVVFEVQSRTGIVKSLDAVPLGLRVENALLSYVKYIGKGLWPVNLAVFYPFPAGAFLFWQAAVSGVALAVVLWLVVRLREDHPYLLTGWLWYLGMLVPVIGLVQVGVQGMADRYAYLPILGPLVAAVWGLGDLVSRSPARRRMLAFLGVSAIVALAAVTRVQVGYWSNSESLFAHAAEAVPGNYWAHYNVGVEMDRRGVRGAAKSEYERAIEIKPDFSDAHYNLAILLAAEGGKAEAIRHYIQAIRYQPKHAPALSNLAALLAEEGRLQEAVRCYRQALQADNHLAEAHLGLGVLMEAQGDQKAALASYRAALRCRPGWRAAQDRLAALVGSGER